MELYIDRSDDQTIERCITICKERQKQFAGLQVCIKYFVNSECIFVKLYQN